MLNIKILGSGCPNCKRLEQLVLKVVDELGVEAEIIKVTNPAQYVDYGVMSTPGLVINDKTVSSGRIPSIAEITDFIRSALVTS